MSEKDGGAAFPEAVSADTLGGLNFSREPGMSLRDYFATRAPNIGTSTMWAEGESSIRIEAVRAYRWADAMIAEREK